MLTRQISACARISGRNEFTIFSNYNAAHIRTVGAERIGRSAESDIAERYVSVLRIHCIVVDYIVVVDIDRRRIVVCAYARNDYGRLRVIIAVGNDKVEHCVLTRAADNGYARSAG